MKIEVTAKVKKNIDRFFAVSDAEFVLEMFENAKFPNTTEYERIFLAIIKLSEGNLVKFQKAFDLAKEDWRDVLVAAGFGNIGFEKKIAEYFD